MAIYTSKHDIYGAPEALVRFESKFDFAEFGSERGDGEERFMSPPETLLTFLQDGDVPAFVKKGEGRLHLTFDGSADEQDLRLISQDYPNLTFLMSWTRWRGSNRVFAQGGWAFRGGIPLDDSHEADIESHGAHSAEAIE